MAFVYLVAGFILLMISGNYLVKGSVQLARHFKISTLLVGLTVVAFGTSAPELFVSVKAAFKGASDIAVGNVIGSNIANIALILGLVALVYPIAVRNRSILFDWIVMTIASLALLILGYNGTIGLLEGIIFLLCLGIYLWWSFYISRKSIKTSDVIPIPTMGLYAALSVAIVSIVGLYFGAEWLVMGARELAISWGVSDRVIGISIVAFGTSVPELATSIIASFRKETDISVGNIIGSNIFNVFAVLGVTAVIKPLPIGNPEMFTVDMVWVLGLSIVLLAFMLPLSRGLISRWKGGLLLLTYISYIYLLFN
jgi:cation:H+ antiporter